MMGLKKKIPLPLTCSQRSASNCSNLEGQAMRILSMDRGCQLADTARVSIPYRGHEVLLCASSATPALLSCFTHDWAGRGAGHL